MNLIVAVDEKWGIGKRNDLLFHLSADLKYFKEKTLNKTIVMGEKTFLSLPKRPLPNRENVIITLDKNFKADGTVIFNDLKDVLNYCKDKDAFVCGGGQIYKLFLPYCKTAYITKVFADGGAEVSFENVDAMSNWVLKEKSPTQKEGDLEYCFCVYENTSPLN